MKPTIIGEHLKSLIGKIKQFFKNFFFCDFVVIRIKDETNRNEKQKKINSNTYPQNVF